MSEQKPSHVVYAAPQEFFERLITADQWAAIGAVGMKDTKWDKANKWRLPVGDFTAEALVYVNDVDPELSVE